jgi:hypothetical protein
MEGERETDGRTNRRIDKRAKREKRERREREKRMERT